MAMKRTSIIGLIDEARRLEAEHEASHGPLNEAEASGDEAAIERAYAAQARACDAACRAEADAINATPETPAEAIAQMRYVAGLSGITYDADIVRMVGRAVAVIEPAMRTA